MINQRQGGRRRGRGGQRGQNLGGQPGGGNRQDNRQRGNAAQLLEKYKSMARDAQLAGDRVQSEYYLQFADHYFRVLSENRVRFEDQRRQRDDDSDEDEGEDDLAAETVGEEAAAESGEQRYERPRRERNERGDRGDRGDRGERPRRFDRQERNAANSQDLNGAEADRDTGSDERIAMDVLPPAIGREEASDEGEGAEEAVARPRRRTRRPRPDDGESEIAPAA